MLPQTIDYCRVCKRRTCLDGRGECFLCRKYPEGPSSALADCCRVVAFLALGVILSATLGAILSLFW